MAGEFEPGQRFITFEGGEGAGKTTQIQRLASALGSIGPEVVTTREPGGSVSAEAIRTLLLDPVHKWAALSEAFLHSAARHEHLRQTVRPALEAGKWVLCDRFADSTLAYQAYGQGVSIADVKCLTQMVVGDVWPSLTFILDVPVSVGLARARERGQGTDRYESMDVALHDRLREGFLRIANEDPARCVVIDATRTADEVHDTIRETLNQRLGLAI